MLHLTQETERLARRVAARAGKQAEDVIRSALENEAKVLGLSDDLAPRQRMTAEEMLAVGDRIGRLPLLDPRSPDEIMDELNEL